MNSILVLEDDRELNNIIYHSLMKENYRVFSAHLCKEAKSLIDKNTIDLTILDVNLPDGNGFEFCKWLKARYNIPVVFLSARDLEDDVLSGYELGADDYVTKPFSMKILLKKISVILSREQKNLNVFDDGFIKIDFELGTVKKEDDECALTPTEYRILKKLIEHKGQLLTYSLLLDSLWDEGADDYVTKPFSMKILLKKISVILSREQKNLNVFDDGFIKIDFELGTVKKEDDECALTPTEYRILKKLIEHKGQLLTYSLLLDSLWDEGIQLMDKHTLAVNINRLRKKIETKEHTYISNVYGMGYIWK